MNKNPYPLRRGFLAALAILAFVTRADAALLVYEGFDYSGLSNGASLVGSNGGTGFTAGSSWALADVTNNNPTSGGTPLYYNTTGLTTALSTQLAAVGGAARDSVTTANNHSGIERTFDAVDITGTGQLWFSFLVQPTAAGNMYLSLGDGSASFNTTGAGIHLNLSTSSGVSARLTASTGSAVTPFTVNTTYFMVGRFSYAPSGTSDTFDLWINPTSDTLGTANSTVSIANATFALNTLVIHSLASATSNFDEFRLGTTQADVMAVPEPATVAALLGVGVLGVASARRRRHAV